jgi:hypothetical protein
VHDRSCYGRIPLAFWLAQVNCADGNHLEMHATGTRRYVRYYMHTPVYIAVPGATSIFVPGLVTKLSRTGMELHAGVNLQPGELMEVEFRATDRTIRIAGTVRNRSGFCFGLEFSALRVELEKTARSLPI